jgi:hypothetical protein
MDHCEFAEAEFTDVCMKFINVSGSDFVGTRFEDVVFEDCDFTSGEWRASQFTRVQFIRCTFKFTTINLCVFDDCSFCEQSTVELDHTAVNYNVFSRTSFNSVIRSDDVLSNNFGLPGNRQRPLLVLQGSENTLESMCLSCANGHISVPVFVESIENEFNVFSQTRLKKLKLEFISNIISSLARNGNISASSMIYIENLLYDLARSVKNEADLRTVMSAIVIIRNALFDLEIQLAESRRGYEIDSFDHIIIRYEKSFSMDDAKELAEVLSYIAAQNSHVFVVTEVIQGSTLIKISNVKGLVKVFSIIIAIQHIIGQATITIKQGTQFVRSVTEFRGAISECVSTPMVPANYPVSLQKEKIRSILNGPVASSYEPVRKVVAEKGKGILRFDEKATAVIDLKPDQSGKKRVK